MSYPFFEPAKDAQGQWRIFISQNGYKNDLCGAVNEVVAWEQCVILNRMRRPLTLPVRSGQTQET